MDLRARVLIINIIFSAFSQVSYYAYLLCNIGIIHTVDFKSCLFVNFEQENHFNYFITTRSML